MTSTVSQKRPRQIRAVTKWTGKTGRRVPKVVVDRRLHHAAERIKAVQPRPCDSFRCPWPNHVGHSRHGIINGGTYYVRITQTDVTRRMGSKHIPLTKDYHPDCVPDEDRPLVRILIGYRWIAQTCVSENVPTSYRRFTSAEAWDMWVDKEFPSYRMKWNYTGNDMFQVGTGYQWSTLTRYHGRMA